MKSSAEDLSAQKKPKHMNKPIEMKTSAKNSPRSKQSNLSKACTEINYSVKHTPAGKTPNSSNNSLEIKPPLAEKNHDLPKSSIDIKSSIKDSPKCKIPNLSKASTGLSVKPLPAGNKPNQKNTHTEEKSCIKASPPSKNPNMPKTSVNIKSSGKGSPAGINDKPSKVSRKMHSSEKDSPSKKPNQSKVFTQIKSSLKGQSNMANTSKEIKVSITNSTNGKKPNSSKASTGLSSPIKNIQSAKKPGQDKTPTMVKPSDEDSSSIITHKNKTSTPVEPSTKSVLQMEKNKNMTKTSKELKCSNSQSLYGNKYSNSKTSSKTKQESNQSKSATLTQGVLIASKDSQCNQAKETIISSQDITLFDEEPSEEFTSMALQFSPSKISGEDSDFPSNRSKLSFRKISMEVASALPLDNDSEEEEEEVQEEEQCKAESALLQGPESEPVIPSSVSSMTKEQIEEHISCCLQLNTENKINTKNAFALKLIDCMTVMMKTAQDESNFAAVACQLDAGAKIYSNRVDAVHQQAMKLAESCLFAEKKDKKKKDKDSEDESNEDYSEETSDKARRKKAKKKILAAPEQITRKLKGKDPRENYVQFEARPGGIMEKARRDPKDLSFTLEKHVPFWHDGPGTSVGGFVKIPKIDLKSRQITPGLDMESLLKYLPRRRTPSPEPSTSTEFIPQPSSPPDDEGSRSASPFSETLQAPPNSYDSDFEEEVETSEKLANAVESRLHIVSLAESRMSKEMASTPSRLDVIRTLFHTEGENDYNYLKMDCKEYWAGPSYWKRPQGINAAAYKKKNIRKKKEPVEIKYDKESDLEEAESKKPWNLVSCKRTTQLSKRTMANWSKKKVTFPPDIHFEPQTFFQLFNIEIKPLLSDEGQEDKISTGEEECDLPSGDFQEEDENHTDAFGDCDTLPLSEITVNQQTCDTLPADHINTDGNPTVNPDVLEEEVTESSNPASSDDVYEGDNLVPMVKMVQVEPIRCVAKPNRVDFQHLKQVMLEVIQENIEDKENQNAQGTPSGTVAFKDVMHELFNSNRLHHRTREDLTVAMAFLSLLTLTNEHSLCLNQPENSANEDIIISYEKTANN